MIVTAREEQRDSVCVCVFVCVRERERERESACAWVCGCVRDHAIQCECSDWSLSGRTLEGMIVTAREGGRERARERARETERERE